MFEIDENVKQNENQKAKLKEKLIWWVVSVVVITSAVSIINLIINIMNDII